MEMTMSRFMKDSEDELSMTKRKRRVDWFVFLPDEILLEILKRVPDVFLRYKAKYVCRRWFSIITNRILLDHASFIFQKFEYSPVRLLDIREEGQGLQVKVQYLDIPLKGIIRSWCNEFLLMSNSHESLYVYNLITKEGSYLPYCFASCYGHHSTKCGVGLSFDRFNGIYKVVHLFMDRTIECHILILRKNINFFDDNSLWKEIKAPSMNGGQGISGDPVSVQGRYYNWIIYHSNFFVSVDIVKEEICIKSLPGFSDCSGQCIRYFFVMDGLLALFDSRDKSEVWILKDFHRVKWEKFQSISGFNKYFDRYPGKIDTYHIYGMISKRYIILKSTMYGMFSYDLENGVMERLLIHHGFSVGCVVHSSALSLK